MNNLLLIFLGGGLGSITRYGISAFVQSNFNSDFPIATLCSNLISCVILGGSVAIFSEKLAANSSLRMFILIGFCGGFSTFSTFSYETVELLRTGNLMIAFLKFKYKISSK